MFIIREIFVCKPGQASKLAKLFKKMMKNYPDTKRIMTDMTGPYNTVVVEFETESLAEWEKEMNDMRAGKPDPKMNPEVTEEEMKNYVNMYTHGKREIWRVE